MRMHPWSGMFQVLVLMAAALLAGGCGRGADTKQPPGSQDPAKQEPKKTGLKVDLSVSAEQVAKDYIADKAAADKKYKDKVLEVEGLSEGTAIDSSIRSHGVFLTGYQDQESRKSLKLRCMVLPAFEDLVFDISRGQKVKLKGKCQGETDTQINVVLTDCEILDTGPDVAIAVTAVQLTKEYAENKDAAQKKYGEKQLIIEGVVCVEWKLGHSLKLEGYNENAAKPLRVSLSLPRRSLEHLKKGHRVKLKAHSPFVIGMGDVEVSGAFEVK